jgi:polysaccharide transporter, PST family
MPFMMQLRRSLKGGLTGDVVALYATYAANYGAPLVVVPYLARVLGPAQWGMVALAQVFGWYVVILVEFGFALSACREVSRYRNDPERLSDIVAGVLGAKLCLALVGALAALIMFVAVPAMRSHPLYLVAAFAWALGQAFSMSWFYQGMEAIKTAAVFEGVGKVLAAALTFALVRQPAHGWRVLGIQAGPALISSAILLALTYRRVRFRLPDLPLAFEALRLGWSMFLFRSSVSVFALGNALILGFFAPPIAVGYYAGAEKIHRALQGLTQPIAQSFYPRLTYSIVHSRDEAISLARRAAVWVSCVGIVTGLVMFISAPLLVRLLLGSGFEPAIPVLRVFAFSLPLAAISNVLGGQWMLPLGMDATFSRAMLSAGLLNLILAAFTARAWGQMGMAISVTICEVFLCISLYWTLYRRKLHPMTDRSILRRRIDDVMGVTQ